MIYNQDPILDWNECAICQSALYTAPCLNIETLMKSRRGYTDLAVNETWPTSPSPCTNAGVPRLIQSVKTNDAYVKHSELRVMSRVQTEQRLFPQGTLFSELLLKSLQNAYVLAKP